MVFNMLWPLGYVPDHANPGVIRTENGAATAIVMQLICTTLNKTLNPSKPETYFSAYSSDSSY